MNASVPDLTTYQHKIDPSTPAEHGLEEGDLVILKDDAPPPVGVNSAFRPKCKLRIYKVIKTIPNSANVVIQDTQSQEERVSPTIKLITFSPESFFPLYKRDLVTLDWLTDNALRKKMAKEETRMTPNQGNQTKARRRVQFNV